MTKPSKLWQKNIDVDRDIELYTVGRDREMDMYLASSDILGSIAHITMLKSIGLLKADEHEALTIELRNIYDIIQKGKFEIQPGVEDVHSQVELMLTDKLGDLGKKIHSGRSRNDQVLVDLKLFIRSRILDVTHHVSHLFTSLIDGSEHYRDVIMPGYTHLQVAMPSSAGLWLGAYAESLADDMVALKAAFDITNRNPLGSAAGYGSSFPLDRDMTSRLLGFESTVINSVYAQMGRGKTERIVASAIGNIAATISKLAYDACMFNSQNFGFITLDPRFTTGSSIMPHKKNPDVFELTRSRANRLQALAGEITLMTNNLPSGYFRDLQLIKETFLPAFDQLEAMLDMTAHIINNIKFNKEALNDPRYDAMYSVEEVNRRVLRGIPFRDAYRQVGLEIENGTFVPDTNIHHTHLGSIGNLGNDRIKNLFNKQMDKFMQYKDMINHSINILLTDNPRNLI